jgi:hypothetical protein
VEALIQVVEELLPNGAQGWQEVAALSTSRVVGSWSSLGSQQLEVALGGEVMQQAQEAHWEPR